MKEQRTPTSPTLQLRISERIFRILLILGALAIILGATWLAALRADRELRADLLPQVYMVATAVNPQMMASLRGTPADLNSPEYKRIKEQLARIRSVNPNCRFLYLMSRKSDGTIIFHVDSEPSDSKDCSPPGQAYYEAPAELHDVFTTGKATVRGPYTDRWGTWISAFVPLNNPAAPDGKIVFGMDTAASDWIWTIAKRAVLPAALVAIAVILALFAVSLMRSRRNLRAHREELLESEAALNSIFKAAPVGLAIMKDRVLQSVNRTWCDNSGYSESELIGKDTRLIYESEGEYERVGRELFMDLPERGLASVQTRHRRKDGVLRDVILTAAPLPSETSSLEVVIAVEDVTERKKTEKALRDNRKQLADIIEFLPDATLVIDRSGQVITWNRAIETLTGISKEEMIGKDNHQYAIPFYGKSRPILVDYALQMDHDVTQKYTAIQRTGDILFGEAFASNLSSGDVHLSGMASVLRDEKGEIIAAIECIRDNTERRRLEERLKRAEKMEALGTLAGGVAHDLNNVLGVMVGYSELLLDLLPQGSPLKKYADHILQSSIKGATIIQDLLTLARRGVVVSEVVHLNKVILDYFQSPEFEKMIAYHPGVKITTDLEAGLLNLKGSPVHLSKVIMNLVSNAAEAISGPGEIMIRTENRHLDKPIRGYEEMQAGDYLVLTVSDSGNGISTEDLGKIFEPFYTKKVMGRSGTGLGLPVVWGTVKDHRGHIDVQSEEGKGSCFTLYFPVSREAAIKSEQSVSPLSYLGRGETILVVDDVKEQRELAMNMLSKVGYRVEAVGRGEEAVEWLKERKADLLVLDMIMDPGIDGLETYRRIIDIIPGQKAIIVSGFSETDRVRKMQEMGAGTFVRKPYILEKLGLAVRHELDRKCVALVPLLSH